MEPYRRNFALEWYQYGLEKEDDFFIRFMMHWVAFNWLYNSIPKDSERAKIQQYYDDHKDQFEKYDAFSSPDIEVFRRGQVYCSTKEDYSDSNYKGIMRGNTKKLLLTLYAVRCNLFHGSKSLINERDQELVRSSANILEGYLKALLTP